MYDCNCSIPNCSCTHVCQSCGGKGYFQDPLDHYDYSSDSDRIECSECGGKGKISFGSRNPSDSDIDL